MIDYNSPLGLLQYLREHSLGMQKRFSQNFLINGAVRRRIARLLCLNSASYLWEIGPGIGAMTYELLLTGAKVVAFEIDRGFCASIRESFASYIEAGSLRLIQGDFLDTYIKEARYRMPDVLFGNLPYSVGTLILVDSLKRGVRYQRIVAMLQKEVALRLCAKVGESEYGYLSAIVSWGYTVKQLMTLKGGNFWPRPKVDSTLIELTPRGDYPICKDPKAFVKLLDSAFSKRRKTIRNNLKDLFPSKEALSIALAGCNIEPMKRAQELTIEELLALSAQLS